MKRNLVVALAAGLVASSLMISAGTAQAKKPSGPLVVGTDAAGDWGDGSNNAVGDALGQDLLEASIGPGEAGMLNFVIKVNSLPAAGGTPEVTRYNWSFTVDGEYRELDGKFTNFSRGTCDPTAGTCPPPRNPGLQPFFLRGNCATDATLPVTLTTCEELATIQALFDAGAGTITIPVPLEALPAKKGTKIVGAAGTLGGTIAAIPSAFVSGTNFPMDTMATLKTYTVR